MRPRCFALLFASALALAAGDAHALGAGLSREILTIPGINPGDRFGAAIAGDFDWNADGRPDLAVGAFAWPKGQGIGRVSLFSMGTGFDALPEFEFGGSGPSEYFAFSLATAHDINGDGWNDLLVGVPRGRGAAQFSGRVLVYFGGPAADTLADLRLSGTEANQQFGISLAVPGDVNGDGWDDILAGAYNPITYRGTVSLFYGGPAADSLPDLVIHSSQLRDNLGYTVSGAGDLNGDGFADFAVGGWLWSVSAPPRQEGRTWVYFGGAAPDTVADLVITGKFQNQHFGLTLASGGDLDRDGFGDLLIGDAARTVYLYRGGAAPDSVADLVFADAASAAGTGDANGDGADDLALGGRERGSLVLGGSELDSLADYTLSRSGLAAGGDGVVAHAGDLTGDGGAEMVLGLASEQINGAARGAVHIVQFSRYFLLQPNGGNDWIAGGVDTVKWLGSDSVAVDLSLDAGATWSNLAIGSGAGTGMMLVPVPDTLSAQARLRVRSPNGALLPSQVDESDGTFRIIPHVLIGPSPPSSWLAGDADSVVWRGVRPADVWMVGRKSGVQVRLAAGAGGLPRNALAFRVPLMNDDSVYVLLLAAGVGVGDPTALAGTAPSVIRPFEFVAPAGGGLWVTGETQLVSWKGTLPADVYLVPASGPAIQLAAGVGGAALDTAWVTVPVMDAGSGTLRVVAAGLPPSSPLSVSSSQPVTLKPFDVLYPETSQDWLVGSADSIVWRGTLPADLWLEPVNGAPRVLIASARGGAARNSHAFTVPLLDQSDVRVVVSQSSPPPGPVPADSSVGQIRVVPFRIYRPTNRVTWNGGTTDSVLWLGTSRAAVDLSIDAGTNWSRLADAAGGSEVNSARVNVPDVITNRAVVRLTVAGATPGGGHSVSTTGFFSITRPGYLPESNVHRVVSDSSDSVKDQLGYSAANAGDVNGDGYQDLIVGRPYSTVSNLPEAGRAQIYFGGPQADGVPDVVLLGAEAYDHFGWSVASAGDFNGDRFGDVAVGAPGAGTGGQIRVFYGGPHMDAISDVALSNSHLTILGNTLSPAGDVNRDGYGDLVAGANIVFGQAGGTYVPLYLGGPTPQSVREIQLISPGPVGSFGSVAAGVGDVNADGFTDVAVALVSTASSDTSNYVFVWLGRAVMANGLPNVTFKGNKSGGFGSAIAPAGDFDDDGYQDFAVGSYFWNGPRGPVGRVYVYRGGPALGTSGFAFDGPNANERFGRALAGDADLNGDGIEDLAIGADGSDVRSTDAGRVYVHFGAEQPDSIPDVVLDGSSARAQLGFAVAFVPRFAETDFGVLAIGSPQSVVVTAGGRVDLFEVVHPTILTPVGGETWVAGEPAEIRWRGVPRVDVELSNDDGASWTTLGSSVGGQEINVLQIVAPAISTRLARVRVRVTGEPIFRANSDVSDVPFRIVPRNPEIAAGLKSRAALPPRGGARTGERVAAAGDVNGDGLADRLVLSRAGSAANAPARVDLVLGGADSAAATFAVPGSGNVVELAGLGDMNRDGFGDFAVGSPDDATSGVAAGRVFLFRGSAAPDALPDLTLEGPGAGWRLGAALAAAGDLDGDTYPDLAAAAPGWGDGHGGAVWIYRGGPVLDAVADRALHNPDLGDGFGAALAGPGDLNGDGVDDLAIGAPRRVSDNDAAGRVLVLFGSAALDTFVDVTIRGTSADEAFGSVLARAGDVNDDGFADLLVGAPSSDGAGVDAGRAYLCLGGSQLKTSPSIRFPGSEPGAFFGAALAGGVDVNADGFPDMLIGAPFGGGGDRGTAALFYGGVLPDSLADHAWSGAPGDRLGASVALLGADGVGAFGAVLAGAPYASGAGAVMEWSASRYWVAATAAGVWALGSEQSVTWLGAERATLTLVGASGMEVALGASLGGAETNTLTLRVPAGLGAWARVHVVPSAAGVTGEAWSDTVRIESAIALTAFTARVVTGGVQLAWASSPGVGPQGLNAYRLYRIAPNGARERIVAESLLVTTAFYPERERGARYALAAVNGLGEEIALGEAGLPGLAEGLRVWPVPMGREGLTLEMAVPIELDGRTAGDFAVEVYDVTGRRVAEVARGKLATEVGLVRLHWDGRAGDGARVHAGLYFVRARAASQGFERTRRVVVR